MRNRLSDNVGADRGRRPARRKAKRDPPSEISNCHTVVTASTATPGVPFQVKKRKCGRSRRGSDATRVVQAFKHDPEVQVSYCNRAGRAETSASVAASSLASISVAGS
jgi:hypothetical protein